MLNLASAEVLPFCLVIKKFIECINIINVEKKTEET